MVKQLWMKPDETKLRLSLIKELLRAFIVLRGTGIPKR